MTYPRIMAGILVTGLAAFAGVTFLGTSRPVAYVLFGLAALRAVVLARDIATRSRRGGRR